MIGSEIGGYRIIEQIGMGGMAVVYKAFDPKTERYVALKVLPQQYSKDATFLTRFENEARSISNLEHLHILPVFAYGEQDGISYMAMRFMDSGTLADRIRQGAIPLSDCARILRQLGEALDYAHSKGILHRDIKPSNALLDKSGNAYLTDFGIAKMVGNASALDLTGSGLIGTPFYMSPEQCRGERELTPASDLYALGVVLYEMVTGLTPYRAETPLAVLQMHIMNPLPDARANRPELPETAAHVIMKSMEKEPADRYPTGRAMAEAFERALASGVTATNFDDEIDTPTIVGDLPTSTVKPRTRTLPNQTQPNTAPPANTDSIPQTVTVIQTERSLVPYIFAGISTLVAVLALVLVVLPQDTRNGLLVGVGLMQATETPTPTITPSPTPTFTVTPSATPTVTPTLTPTMLAAQPFESGVVGVIVASHEQNDIVSRLVRDLTGGGAQVVSINFSPTTAEAQSEVLETYNAPLLAWSEAGAEADQLILNFVVQPDAPVFIDSQGAALLISSPLRIELSPDTDPRFVRNLTDGLLAYLDGRFSEADSALGRAASFSPEAALPPVLFYRGLSSARLENWNDAVRYFNDFIEAVPNLPEALNNRGVSYLVVDEDTNAVDDFTAALRLNPDLAYTYSNRALAYLALEQPENAIDDLDAAIGIEPDNDVLFRNRAQVYTSAQQYDRALADYNRAIALQPNDTTYYLERAFVQSYISDSATIIADLDTVLQLDPGNLDALASRGRIKLQSGDVTGAEADYQAMLAIDPASYTANQLLAELYYYYYGNVSGALQFINSSIQGYTDDAYSYLLRGQIYNTLGQWENARADLDQALALYPEYTDAQAERAYAQYRIDYNTEAALTALEAAISADDYLPLAYNYLGVVLYESGDLENARLNLQQAIALDGSIENAHINLGRLYTDTNQISDAIAAFTDALAINDENAYALALRSYVYTLAGNFMAARADVDACRRISPDFDMCYAYDGFLRLQQGDYTVALQSLTNAITIAEEPQTLDWRAQTYAGLGNYAAAITDLDVAVQKMPFDPVYVTRRGLYRVYTGDFEGAQEDLDLALELNSGYAPIYFAQGTLALTTFDYDAAVRAFNQALTLNPASENYLGRARAYLQLGEYEASRNDLNEALRLNPNNLDAVFVLGQLAFITEDYPTAIERTTAYLQRFPTMSEALYVRGVSYARTGENALAMTDLTLSVAGCRTECEVTYAERGLLHLVMGDNASARRDFEVAIGLNTNYMPANVGLARVAFDMGDLTSARLAVTRVLEQDSLQPDALIIRGLLALSDNDRSAALQDIGRGVLMRGYSDLQTATLVPGQPVTNELADGQSQHFYWIELTPDQQLNITLEPSETFTDPLLIVRNNLNEYLALNDTDAQGQLLPSITGFTPTEAGTYTLLVTTLGGAGSGSFTLTVNVDDVVIDYSALSIAELSDLITSNPNNVEALTARAEFYRIDGDLVRAREDVDAVLVLSPNNARAFNVLGSIYLVERDYPAAVQALTDSINANPTVLAYVRRASAYRAQSLYTEAQADLDAAFSIDPTNADASYQQGLLSYFTQDYQRAVDAFTENLKVYVDDSLGHYWRGLSHYELGLFEESVADFTISIAGCTSECHFDYRHRGDALLKLQRFTEARADYEMALEMQPNIGEAYTGLGIVEAVDGRGRSATDNFNRAFQILRGSVQEFETTPDVDSYQGTLEAFSAQHEYTFTTGRGIVSVSVQVPEGSVFRPVVLVRDATGNAIAASDVDASGNIEPVIRRLPIPSAGEYTIVIGSYNALTTGSYTLNLQRP